MRGNTVKCGEIWAAQTAPCGVAVYRVGKGKMRRMDEDRQGRRGCFCCCWLAFTVASPSSRSSVPRVMKDRSHIPAATFAIAGNSHMAMCEFSGISTANLRLLYIINPVLREKARAQHLATPRLEVRVSTRSIGVRLISMCR